MGVLVGLGVAVAAGAVRSSGTMVAVAAVPPGVQAVMTMIISKENRESGFILSRVLMNDE
jgi:hypothetical protein